MSLGDRKTELNRLSRFKKHVDGSKPTKFTLQQVLKDSSLVVKSFEELAGMVKSFLKQ